MSSRKTCIIYSPLFLSTPSLFFPPTPLNTLCRPSILLHHAQLNNKRKRKKNVTFSCLCFCICNHCSTIPTLLHIAFLSFFLSAPSLSVESAQNEGSSLSGVNRRCVGEAERMTSFGCNANILPSSRPPKISHNVNCAITAMADTDRSLALGGIWPTPDPGKIPPAESLSIPASDVSFSTDKKKRGDGYEFCMH